ncbi:uncharacterized protein LOC142592696 isoform X3 [Dermacentor variabilis]|uniref:uncharacterized protein LOC142592696 isoform X3 n=1 Tax=Dermacentor variabilis TaxID=34621 RepID=UPI003F5C97AC
MKLIKRAHRQERSLAKHLEKNKDVPESLNKGTRDRRQELAGGCQDVLNFQGAQVVQVAAAASPEEDDEEQIKRAATSSLLWWCRTRMAALFQASRELKAALKRLARLGSATKTC